MELDPKYYVIKKGDGFITTDMENYENLAEDIEKGVPTTAEDILERVKDVDISLVTDQDPNVWEVQWMQGKELTKEMLQKIK